MDTQLIATEKQLPSTIEELVDFVLVGNEVIKSWKAKLNAIDKVELTKDARDQALRDGQQVGECVLYAEAKLGQLIEPLSNPTLSRRGKRQLPEGINWKFSHFAQELHRHTDLIEKAIETARQRETIATRHDVLKMIKEQKRADKIQRQKEEINQGLELLTGTFDIIVIDPPWTFEGEYDADGRRTTAPYPTMTYEEIEQINIPANDNCILWLWCTHKDIFCAKNILESWGFEYKGILVWDKEIMGIGTWLRFQCEFCLLGIKGKPLWENKNIRDIIREPRREHSRKPDAFYKMIDDNFIGRKLDYFGRIKRDNWSIYGSGQNSV